MTTEEIVKAAHEAGFGSSEIHQRIAEFKRLIESAAAAEREACAKLCDERAGLWPDEGGTTEACASDIRARG